MNRRPPRSTRTDTLFPYTTLFQSTYPARPAARPDLSAEGAPYLWMRGRPVPTCRPPLPVAPWQPGRVGGYKGPSPEMPTELKNDGRERSEKRRVGKEGVSTGRSRWSPYH